MGGRPRRRRCHDRRGPRRPGFHLRAAGSRPGRRARCGRSARSPLHAGAPALGELARARELLDLALDVEPGSPDLRLCLGNLHFLGKDFESAASSYRAALGLGAGRPEPKWNLALTYERMGRRADARSLWQELARDARFGARARLRLAETSAAPDH